MRKILLLAVLSLAACASPTFQMSPEQVAGLSDDQLCAYKNGYRDEVKLDAEVARRNLNCNRHYRECLRRGNEPNTEAMNFCIDLLRQNERLKYEADFGHDRHHHGGLHTGVGVGFGF